MHEKFLENFSAQRIVTVSNSLVLRIASHVSNLEMDKQIKFTIEGKNSLQELNIDAQKAIKKDLKKLAKGELEGKPLTEQLTGFFSLIVRNYRAIYTIDKEKIIVFIAGHRRNIYDKLRK